MANVADPVVERIRLKMLVLAALEAHPTGLTTGQLADAVAVDGKLHRVQAVELIQLLAAHELILPVSISPASWMLSGLGRAVYAALRA